MIPRVYKAAIYGALVAALVGWASVARGDMCGHAKSFLKLKMFYEAEFSARNCIKAAPVRVQNWVYLTKALAYQKKYNESLAWINRVINRFPDDLDHITFRIRILAWSGQLRQAWKEKVKIEKAANKDPDKAHLIADIAYWNERFHEAIRWYDFILRRWPRSARARLNRSRCLKGLGEKEYNTTPARPIRVAARPKPANPRLATKTPTTTPKPAAPKPVAPQPSRRSCLIYRSLLRKKQLKSAEEHMRACVKWRARNFYAWNMLFKLLLDQGRIKDALADVDAAIRDYPTDGFFRFWRLRLLVSAGQHRQAWKESASVDQFSQRNLAAARLSAGIAMRVGQFRVAIKRYKRVLDRWPNHMRARYNLARAYQAVGRVREAVLEYEMVCKTHKHPPACKKASSLP